MSSEGFGSGDEDIFNDYSIKEEQGEMGAMEDSFLDDDIKKNLLSDFGTSSIIISDSSLGKMMKQVFTGRRQLYNFLSNLGVYLPSIGSRGCDMSFLLSIATNKSFYLKRSEMRRYTGKKIKFSRIGLLFYLKRILKSKDLELELKTSHVPEKEWLLNMIYTLHPGSLIFANSHEPCLSKIDSELMLQSINKNHRNLYQTTETHQMQMLKLILRRIEIEVKISCLIKAREEISEELSQLITNCKIEVKQE
jgi:hypothetical protein